MRRGSRLALVVLGLGLSAGLTGILAAQESLLPPGFDERPAPRPRPTATPRATPAPRPGWTIGRAPRSR